MLQLLLKTYSILAVLMVKLNSKKNLIWFLIVLKIRW